MPHRVGRQDDSDVSTALPASVGGVVDTGVTAGAWVGPSVTRLLRNNRC